MGEVRWKKFIQNIILAIFSFNYQKMIKIDRKLTKF